MTNPETDDQLVERLDHDLRYVTCPHKDGGPDGMLARYRVKCEQCRKSALREALRIGREQAAEMIEWTCPIGNTRSEIAAAIRNLSTEPSNAKS